MRIDGFNKCNEEGEQSEKLFEIVHCFHPF